MKTFEVGIIGYGLSGRIFHGAILKGTQGYRVAKIATGDSNKAAQAVMDFPDVKVVDQADGILSDPTIDLVVIASPNTTHCPLAKSALRAGKHVVIEKPFTVTAEEALELIQVAQETGKTLTVYHNRRYDSDFLTVKKCLEEGALGRIVEMTSAFFRFRPEFKQNSWRERDLPGSGILYDLGSHLIDQSLQLFGLPDEVYCDIEAQRQGEVDDAFSLILYYKDFKVNLRSAMLVKEPLPRFTIQGTEGSFVKFGIDVQEENLRQNHWPPAENWGEEPETIWAVLNTGAGRGLMASEKGDYRRFYQDLYQAIESGEPPFVTGTDGYWVIRIIELARLSHSEKRRVKVTQG